MLLPLNANITDIHHHARSTQNMGIQLRVCLQAAFYRLSYIPQSLLEATFKRHVPLLLSTYPHARLLDLPLWCEGSLSGFYLSW